MAFGEIQTKSHKTHSFKKSTNKLHKNKIGVECLYWLGATIQDRTKINKNRAPPRFFLAKIKTTLIFSIFFNPVTTQKKF